jgi:hypothetical protein
LISTTQVCPSSRSRTSPIDASLSSHVFFSAGIFYGIRQRGSNIRPASARPGATNAQIKNSNEINRAHNKKNQSNHGTQHQTEITASFKVKSETPQAEKAACNPYRTRAMLTDFAVDRLAPALLASQF